MFNSIQIMKHFKTGITLLWVFLIFCSGALWAQGNDTKLSLSDEIKQTLEDQVHEVLDEYESYTNFTDVNAKDGNAQFDDGEINDYKRNFDHENCKVYGDVFPDGWITDEWIAKEFKITTLQRYINAIWIGYDKLENVTGDLFSFGDRDSREIIFDDIEHYKKQQYYYIPVLVDKTVHYQMQQRQHDNKVVEGLVELSEPITKRLKMFVNVYMNDGDTVDRTRIVGILDSAQFDAAQMRIKDDGKSDTTTPRKKKNKKRNLQGSNTDIDGAEGFKKELKLLRTAIKKRKKFNHVSIPDEAGFQIVGYTNKTQIKVAWGSDDSDDGSNPGSKADEWYNWTEFVDELDKLIKALNKQKVYRVSIGQNKNFDVKISGTTTYDTQQEGDDENGRVTFTISW